jgi:hypothetical protein
MATRREVPTEAPPPRCFVVAEPGRDLEHSRDQVARDLKLMSDSTNPLTALEPNRLQ